MIEVVFVLVLIVIFLQGIILIIILNERDAKDNEYYTDYKYKNLVLRVYKPEFEYQAIGKVPINKILDGGELTITYKWALIEL